MNNSIDIKTLEAFQNGNHKAFETVFIAYYNKTKAFIDGYIKSESDAEELTEDLFVNLWINHSSIDASKSFNAYLHTIARNAAINYLKHKYVHDTYLNNNQEIEYSSKSGFEGDTESDFMFPDVFVIILRPHYYHFSEKISIFLLSFLLSGCIYSKVQLNGKK